MNPIKLLGLAAFAALVMTAFVGTGTASATILCKERPSALGKCPAGQTVPKGETLTLTLKSETANFNVQSEAEAVTMGCASSAMGGTLTNENQVEGKLESVSIKGEGGAKCPSVLGVELEVIVENLPWTVKAKYEGERMHEDGTEKTGIGTVTAEEQTGKPLRITVKQGAIVTCVYVPKSGKLEAEIINGSKANPKSQIYFSSPFMLPESAAYEEIEKKALCPDTGRFVANYFVARAGGANVYVAISI